MTPLPAKTALHQWWLLFVAPLLPMQLSSAFQAHHTPITRTPSARFNKRTFMLRLHQHAEPVKELTADSDESLVVKTPAITSHCSSSNTTEFVVAAAAALEQPQQPEEDIARDLFLENSQENLALIEEVFEEAQDEDEGLLKGKSDNHSKNPEPLALGEEEESIQLPLFGGEGHNKELLVLTDVGLGDGETLDTTVISASVDGLDVKDTVDAILAVSEEAVSKAEASLSEDVAARLEPFSTHEERDSEISSASVKESPTQGVDDSAVTERTTTTNNAPSVGRILRFAIPAVGVWLCDPLLSLIDTSAVGMLSGTIHQAALTPACAVTDYAALLIAFVFTATTNLVAAARESDRGVEGSPRVTRNLVGSLQLSTYVGAGLGAVLFLYARQFIKAIVGSGTVNPAVIDAATIYVKIRALGMPAAAMIGSAQAACLGLQDIKSQFIVLAAAAVVNFFGDLLFVGSKNAWIGGAAGAAWATVISQYAAVALFAQWLCHRPKAEKAKTLNLSNAILELTGKKKGKGNNKQQDASGDIAGVAHNSKKESRGAIGALRRFSRRPSSNKKRGTVKPKEKPFSVRGFLEGRVKKHEMIQFPSKNIIKEFWPYFLPVTFAQVGRVSGYVAMSYVVASSLGTLAMAAQQIVASIVYCLFPVADSLSLTGQAFVPPIMEKGTAKDQAPALRKTMVNLSKAAGVFGLLTAGAVAFTPLISGFFTSDPAVISMVNGAVPLLAASFPVYALAMAFEGFLLGQKDLGFQGKMYTSWCFIVPYFMLRVKKAAIGGANVGINGVWGVLFGYQVMRFLAWGVRAMFLQRQVEERANLVHG